MGVGDRVGERSGYKELSANLYEEDPWYLLGCYEDSKEPISTTKVSWWCPVYVL